VRPFHRLLLAYAFPLYPKAAFKWDSQAKASSSRGKYNAFKFREQFVRQPAPPFSREISYFGRGKTAAGSFGNLGATFLLCLCR